MVIIFVNVVFLTFLKSKLFYSILGLFLLLNVVLTLFVSNEPDLFDVNQLSLDQAENQKQQRVIGYTSAVTLEKVALTLLNKTGGYISNDISLLYYRLLQEFLCRILNSLDIGGPVNTFIVHHFNTKVIYIWETVQNLNYDRRSAGPD